MIDKLVATRTSRTLTFLALTFLALFLPAWLTLGFAALIALFVPMYVEFLALVIAIEALHRGVAPYSTGIWLPALCIILFLALETSRDYVRERVLRL